MKKLVYLFAYAFLAFALYLNFIHKDDVETAAPPAKSVAPSADQSLINSEKTSTPAAQNGEARPLSQNMGGK